MSHPYAQLHSPTTPTTNEVFPFLSHGQTPGASSSTTPSTSTSAVAARVPRPRLSGPAKSTLSEFFDTVTEYPTAGQKHELLQQVAAICPHYTLSSLNAWFATRRLNKRERARKDPVEAYERDIRKKLCPSLSDADCTKIRDWMVVNTAPKDSMLEQWSRALGKPVKHIDEYVQLRRDRSSSVTESPQTSTQQRRVSQPRTYTQPPPPSRAPSSQRDELEDDEVSMKVDEQGPPRRTPKQSHLPTPGISTSPEPIPHGAGTRAAAPRPTPLNLPPIATLSLDGSDSSVKTEPLHSPPMTRAAPPRPHAVPIPPPPTDIHAAHPSQAGRRDASPVRLASSICHVDHAPPPRSLREFTERYTRHVESADTFMRNAESGRYARLGLDEAVVQQARDHKAAFLKDTSNIRQR